MAKKRKSALVRTETIQIRLTPAARKRVEGIADRTEDTLSDVFRRSLSLYEDVLKHQDAGGKVVLRKRGGSEEVLRV